MYSGEDSSGEALSNKNLIPSWPLSQSTCNMNKDQIDWAALAQQWIQMKESCSSVPQSQQNLSNMIVDASEEQGEAPMEVVKDDEVPSGQSPINNLSEPIRDWPASWYSGNQPQFCPSWNDWATTNGAGVQIPTVQPLNFFKNSNIPLLKNTNENPTTVDVAKKKTLPAWIREGLEKMEREKQKQLEKIKMFGDGEKSDSVKEGTSAESILLDMNEEVEDSHSENEEAIESNSILAITQETQKKSREEIMEELMLVVRKSLTELLLEVTNEEIISVAQESLRKYKTKASSAQVFRKSAISSITGKLGLGAYADSASEDSDSESNHTVEETDSEEEIKENIKMRQNAFKTIAQEIELAIQQSEEKQQPKKEVENTGELSETSPKKGYIKDSGETQPDKKSQNDGKRSKERTSRFSAIKDSKQKTNSYIVQAAAIPCTSYEHDKRKTKTSRRRSYSTDSSSDASESYKKSKKRTKSKDEKHWRNDNRYDSSRASSDSDDHYKKRKYRKSHSGDRDRSRTRSRSRSRSRSHSYSSKRSDKRY